MSEQSKLLDSMISTPSKYFKDPGDVAQYPGLRRTDRIAILRSWKHDVILLMRAAEENMANENDYNLKGVNQALEHEIRGH